MRVSDALEADGAEDGAGELAVAAGSRDQQLGILTGCDELGGGTPVCQTAASRHGTAVVEGFHDRVCLQFFGLVFEGGGVGVDDAVVEVGCFPTRDDQQFETVARMKGRAPTRMRLRIFTPQPSCEHCRRRFGGFAQRGLDEVPGCQDRFGQGQGGAEDDHGQEPDDEDRHDRGTFALSLVAVTALIDVVGLDGQSPNRGVLDCDYEH